MYTHQSVQHAARMTSYLYEADEGYASMLKYSDEVKHGGKVVMAWMLCNFSMGHRGPCTIQL